MVTEEKTKVVYDFEREGRPVNDDEIGAETSERSSGRFPSCFPAEWARGFPVIDPGVSYIEKSCHCGKHVLYAAMFSPRVWPESPLERVRVIEE
ncbi:MAG: hypothetical protein Q7S82_03725 [bacterium]|nr:hypothetical protein [bacterium]